MCLVDVEVLEEFDRHLLPSVLNPEVADELLVRRVKPDADSRSVRVLWCRHHHQLRRRDRSLLTMAFYDYTCWCWGAAADGWQLQLQLQLASSFLAEQRHWAVCACARSGLLVGGASGAATATSSLLWDLTSSR